MLYDRILVLYSILGYIPKASKTLPCQKHVKLSLSELWALLSCIEICVTEKTKGMDSMTTLTPAYENKRGKKHMNMNTSSHNYLQS